MSELTQVSVFIESGPLDEVEYLCDADYQPEEPAILYPNDRAYPGCAASMMLTQVTMVHPETRQNIDVTETVLESEYWTQFFEEELLTHAESLAISAAEMYDESRRLRA